MVAIQNFKDDLIKRRENVMKAEVEFKKWEKLLEANI